MNYTELTNPELLFANEAEVEGFCDLASCVEDLEAFLRECEFYELYEYCAIIREKIKEYDSNRD